MLNYRIYKILFLDALFLWKLEGSLENVSEYAKLRLRLGVAFRLSLRLVFLFLFKILLLRFRKNLVA